MAIYRTSSEAHFWFFTAPNKSRQLLDDSIERTFRGYRAIGDGSIPSGFGNILLGRVESAASFAFALLSGTFLMLGGIFLAPCFLVPATILNLISRAPGISSFKSVENFTRDSSDAICRTVKVCLVALPVIFLFLSVSGINTFLPGVFGPQNIAFDAIHTLVECLGSRQRVAPTIPDNFSIVDMSALLGVEEYFRALSGTPSFGS